MSVVEWKEYIFSDFIEINPTIKLDNKKEYSFVEMKDLQDGKKFAVPSTKRKVTGGARFKNKDTLFARITPCLENGKICQVRDLEDGIGFGSTEFLVFRGKENISDTDFVFYLSRWNEVRKFAEQNLIGTSGRQRVEKEAFQNLILDLPPLSIQRRIAAILSSLDDKIELNRQTNQTLEAIAQALFKEWFIDFNFPGATGEMQDGELGEIPKGWRVGKLGDEGEFKNGIIYSRDEIGDTEYTIINVRDVVGNKFLSKSVLDIIHIDGKKAKQYLLRADDIIIVRSASPGESAIMLNQEENIIYSGFTIRFRVINKRYFLYYFFIFQNVKKIFDSLSNGATVKNINQEMLKAYSAIIPDEKIIIRFNMVIESIFEKILAINEETQTLTQLRDSLLPKLMKSEIKL